MASLPSDLYPSNVTFFNFTALNPADGHCEWKYFSNVGLLKEPGSTICGLITALQGIFGMTKSRYVSVGSRYMFSLLFGYGVMSALHCATLWNGFLRTSGAILNIMQAVIIIRLVNTLKFPPFNSVIHYHHIEALLMSTFGLYPILAHVVGCSFDNTWVSWLTFDLIWAVVLIVLIVIFAYRKHYPQYNACPDMFTVIFNAIICCVAAYLFWLIDRFACVEMVATLRFYGLWLMLIGLTFYYLTCLDIFLQSQWQGFNADITRWPKKYLLLFVYVQWEQKKQA